MKIKELEEKAFFLKSEAFTKKENKCKKENEVKTMKEMIVEAEQKLKSLNHNVKKLNEEKNRLEVNSKIKSRGELEYEVKREIEEDFKRKLK